MGESNGNMCRSPSQLRTRCLRMEYNTVPFTNTLKAMLLGVRFSYNSWEAEKMVVDRINKMLVISLETRPLTALYPPPYKKFALQVCNLELPSRSPLLVVAGAVCSWPWHLRPFLLYQSKKYIWGGGYNSARGLISWHLA